MMKKGYWALIGFLLLVGLPAFAQNQLPGLLRDEYALGLTPPLKSAGMGGAYVGVDRLQSMNPAALSGIDYFNITGAYSIYDHDDGPTGHRGRVDLTAPVPMLGGGARLMLDGLASDGMEETLLPGNAPVEYDGFTLGLQYGRNITDWAAFGFGGYPYEKANVEMGGGVDTEGLSQIGSIQLGTLFRPHEKINIGGQYIYIKDDLEAFLPGGGHMGDYYHIHYFALGVSAMPFDGTLLALDYWNGEIVGDIAPGAVLNQDVDRWNFGIEQRVCDYCDLRLGSNNGGVTAGFTIHAMENLDIDYAYANKMLNDKANLLGETQYHGISVSYRF